MKANTSLAFPDLLRLALNLKWFVFEATFKFKCFFSWKTFTRKHMKPFEQIPITNQKKSRRTTKLAKKIEHLNIEGPSEE